MDFDANSQRWRIYKSSRTPWQHGWMPPLYGSEQSKVETHLICITSVYQHGTKISLINRWSSVKLMGHRTESQISMGVSLIMDVWLLSYWENSRIQRKHHNDPMLGTIITWLPIYCNSPKKRWRMSTISPYDLALPMPSTSVSVLSYANLIEPI